MGQATSTFVHHASATVEIPGKGKIVGAAAKDKSSGCIKSHRYAGIPFAQPPVGPLRWKRPQPLPACFRFDSNGKEYAEFASQCPQATNYALTNGVTFPDRPLWPQSEDCLYLNVWCPTQPDGSRPPRKLPVLFFIHGGWLQIGNAHYSPDGDPSDLLHTAGLDAIVVTTAYRLNAFGFLAHDALRQEDPDHLTGNYGFWDQRAALEWVYNHIQHFGGDPHNITVSGLSAGAHSTHSQLMHEFDLSTNNPAYKPIIRRVFLQSNSAIWPSKPVDETRAQFDQLCCLLDVPANLSDERKLAQLRQVDDMTLVRVLAKMDMHTFRATRDTRAAAFVKPDWTRAMMDGRLAKWCQKHGLSFLIGECDDEEWVYRYINTPTDEVSLVRQVNNYYTLPLVEKMLPYYGVPTSGSWQKSQQQHQANQANQANETLTSAAAGKTTLYSTLGVKPSATASEIRAAYLAKVRRHHPDKLQQQAISQSIPQEDAAAIAESLAQSDELIRQLNHAYRTLVDVQLRSDYDESLAASRAALAPSKQPRISATVEFESFQPIEHDGASASHMWFSYACRCGSEYVLLEEQVHDQVDVIGCEGCSENIRVRYDDDDEQLPHHHPNQLSPDEIGQIFGNVCSDSQVYIAERMLITDLVQGGLSSHRILRYRINYRAKVIDDALPAYRGVSHSFDDFIWWFCSLEKCGEETRIREWLQPWMGFIRGEDVHKQWYGGRQGDHTLIRVLEKDGSIQVGSDRRWEEKKQLIRDMVRVRRELVESFL